MFALLFATSTAKAPIIGIPTAWDTGYDLVSKDYTQSIFRAGGIPLVIPLSTNATEIAQIVERVDGILLPGGEDVDPILFGEEPIPALGEVIPERDEFEFLVLAEAEKRELPVMGVCRGVQVLNVFYNGTLWQDIGSQAYDGSVQRVKHSQSAAKKDVTHTISLLEGTNMQKLLGKTKTRVNSFHHQAIHDVAPGFTYTAIANDGIIEGIEKKDRPNVFGIQWHPEGMVRLGMDEFLPLFKYLVDESAKILTKRGNLLNFAGAL